MELPKYYNPCVISARCNDWVDEEKDTRFIAVLVPATQESIAEGYGIDIPEHWEIWNERVGVNENLDEPWVVTGWKYILEEDEV